MRIITFLILMMVFVTSGINNAVAQEEAVKETPITKWIDAENKMIDSLPKQNQEVFFVMRNKFSVIRSVKMVERDVGNAVKSCGKQNKEIKKGINQRFSEWKNAINPILKEADKFLEQELKEQEAFHVTDFKHITKLNDKAFAFSEKQIKKEPVTTLEACQKLMASMDRTEDQLVNLLQDILLPEEVVRKRLERAKEAEKAAKKAKE